MFTGIVTDIGTIVAIAYSKDMRVRIKTTYETDSINIGSSIAVDGVCLTVIALGYDYFDVNVSGETLQKTNINSQWKVNQQVNLERALKLGDELGGHIVSGHVDGTATIKGIIERSADTIVTLHVDKSLSRFIAQKGSVTLNGVSLTVNNINNNCFSVNLIPYTKVHTTWGQSVVGALINLEVDTLARYVARLIEIRG